MESRGKLKRVAKLIQHGFRFNKGDYHLLEVSGLYGSTSDFIEEITLPITIQNETIEISYRVNFVVSIEEDTATIDCIIKSTKDIDKAP